MQHLNLSSYSTAISPDKELDDHPQEENKVATKDAFSEKVHNWNKDSAAVYEENIAEVREILKGSVQMLHKEIEIDQLKILMKFFASFPISEVSNTAPEPIIKRIHQVVLYKVQSIKPHDLVSIYNSMWLISLHSNADFTKFFNVAIYKLLKSLHSFKPGEIAAIVYSMGRHKVR